MIPTRKVSAGAGAAALSIIVVWALNKYAKADISVEIAQAFQGLFAFVLSYVVPEADQADAKEESS